MLTLRFDAPLAPGRRPIRRSRVTTLATFRSFFALLRASCFLRFPRKCGDLPFFPRPPRVPRWSFCRHRPLPCCVDGYLCPLRSPNKGSRCPWRFPFTFLVSTVMRSPSENSALKRHLSLSPNCVFFSFVTFILVILSFDALFPQQVLSRPARFCHNSVCPFKVPAVASFLLNTPRSIPSGCACDSFIYTSFSLVKYISLCALPSPLWLRLTAQISFSPVVDLSLCDAPVSWCPPFSFSYRRPSLVAASLP